MSQNNVCQSKPGHSGPGIWDEFLGKFPQKPNSGQGLAIFGLKTPTSDKEITIFRPKKPQNPDKALVELPGVEGRNPKYPPLWKYDSPSSSPWVSVQLNVPTKHGNAALNIFPPNSLHVNLRAFTCIVNSPYYLWHSVFWTPYLSHATRHLSNLEAIVILDAAADSDCAGD
ncbi:hypothetical protein B0H10DRAFT_1970068 [Mycena sp. CBHHK59/15]|nr:hypothetical protein B0H10DRAFT_1970068 [Mycena sp. CBHHK59/15]